LRFGCGADWVENFDGLVQRMNSKQISSAENVAESLVARILRGRNRADVQDAMQEAKLNAFRHSGQFEGRAAFSSWFCRIAINEALVLLRRTRNTVVDGEAVEYALRGAVDPYPNPEEQFLLDERSRVLREAIGELTPALRGAMLRYLNGARLSSGTDKCRKFRAIKQLREKLKGVELELGD
jgi:RNA polymerase sigma-70 factor (ECF subfamily)